MLGRYRETVRVWTDPIGAALFRLKLRPNHLTVLGFGVSLLAAAAFVADRPRSAGALLLLAGLCDFFDGSLARASGQVTPFGAFLDSVIDRYSDIVVLLGIVVLFASRPHARGAIVAMAGLVGSVMVSYTKARAESIGVECNVGFMERPERMICLIAGALLDLLEPALWILAILANVTALQRIAFTRRAARNAAILPCTLVSLLATVAACADVPAVTPAIREQTEQAWARAVEAFQAGEVAPLTQEFSADAALVSPISDYAGMLLADALARQGQWTAAQSAALGVVTRRPDSRLAPSALLMAATLAARNNDDAGAQTILKRLIATYRDAAEIPEAIYLLGMTGEATGQVDAAVAAYRQLTVLVPTSAWAEGASDRLGALASAGALVPKLSTDERLDRAERLLRSGVAFATTVAAEAESVSKETRDPGLTVRALKLVARASQRLKRYDVAARALQMAIVRAPVEHRPGLRLDETLCLWRADKPEQALMTLAAIEPRATEAEAAEAAMMKARILENLDRGAEAAAAYRVVATRYPNRAVAGEAFWRLGWLAYLAGDARGAEREWVRLLATPGARSLRVPAHYWIGRARELAGAPTLAAEAYNSVLSEAPRSYYGILAARRAPAPPDVAVNALISLPADPRDAIASDPGFARVDLLRRIGLAGFAVDELKNAVRTSVGDSVRLYGLSGEYVSQERYHLALGILRRGDFPALADTGNPALPRAFWEMFYPFGWRAEITEAALQANLDPFLVAALIREESSFDPQATSPVGARGLMQLMPDTARPLAKNRGLVFGDGSLLEDPKVNVELGASHLAARLQKYGDPRLALAAYNAGSEPLSRWWRARRTDDLEAFVELIPYDETRNYIKRVMVSWEEYRRIYGAP